MNDDLVLSRFVELLGASFRLLDVDPPIDLELFEVAALRTSPSPADAERSFSLLFSGPADRPLDQQTVRLGHDGFSDLRLFIVPVAERDGRRHYEAIVNRTD